ncbi:hypothetical protein A2U01_0116597, partial [Trifolium medium]|nr:hypothetical protein [Trifolium medium]
MRYLSSAIQQQVQYHYSKYSLNHYTPKEVVISVDLYNSTNV